ncbi:MAG: hypothetical protein ACQSGP_13425, partial [Frankia sp.]
MTPRSMASGEAAENMIASPLALQEVGMGTRVEPAAGTDAGDPPSEALFCDRCGAAVGDGTGAVVGGGPLPPRCAAPRRRAPPPASDAVG